ncbi:MAG: hypothetical protein IIZ29_00755, partial [Schwartzia sp.]|nr:hypothetical protein [Schwartzia sp. (in: firmicutes)]
IDRRDSSPASADKTAGNLLGMIAEIDREELKDPRAAACTRELCKQLNTLAASYLNMETLARVKGSQAAKKTLPEVEKKLHQTEAFIRKQSRSFPKDSPEQPTIRSILDRTTQHLKSTSDALRSGKEAIAGKAEEEMKFRKKNGSPPNPL